MFVCRFIRESGAQYSAVTTLRINGADVKAINSPKVAGYICSYINYVLIITKETTEPLLLCMYICIIGTKLRA